ncbi:MAG: T9SS type A sorting domain-containing protein [Bacteroidetes bacterium]|nr:T9SS type A sorting domain-containing protein [Bacteroidota bacterium]
MKATLPVLICAAILVHNVLPAQFAQQGNKLVGTGAVGNAYQGRSVALSADGNTAIVGGDLDSNNAGAAWVYTRTGGMWTQQGNKLVGTGAVFNAGQGISVSLSSDGNTAIIGAYLDNLSAGAAWVFTRSGGGWTQQGNKLVGAGALGSAAQGTSVSLSSDGNTAIIGGSRDNAGAGAAWVFTRSGGVWTQQGNKLVGAGAVGNADQGQCVSLSSDGNTAIVGGLQDNLNAGAAWVYTRSGGVWTQQGAKLVGTGAVGNAQQGTSVSISWDGNTAIVGGYGDNSNAGAMWVYIRSSGVWSQEGLKLVGTGAVGSPRQGYSVSLSLDGNTAIVGGFGDSGNAGAAWVYTRGASGVWGQSEEVPQRFSLRQNYPNPFNPNTVITYDVAVSSRVLMSLYDALGREVRTLLDEEKTAGSYQIQFDASDLSTGVYYYQLRAGEFVETRKLIFLK